MTLAGKSSDSKTTSFKNQVLSRVSVVFLVVSMAIFASPRMTLALTVPDGDGEAHIRGVFDEPIVWPIIPIHIAVLPDGRVMSYGSDENGNQTGQFNYGVWDPSEGTDIDAHTLLPNTTGTDIFCSAQSIIPSSGEMLITGGDTRIDGRRNHGVNDTAIFSTRSNGDTVIDDLRPENPMEFARWYPSLVTMPDGQLVVLGGRYFWDPSDSTNTIGADTPEIYTPGSGWRTLSTAADRFFLVDLVLPAVLPCTKRRNFRSP
ncbi:MAG: hypothetical protein HC834_07855 [Rhodospirillales bacterium]|nr:hypothetical protein [Rhodospirillales bacterium]